MLEHVRFIVAVLARRFRSRVVELENLALRHQLHVLHRQRSAPPDRERPPALGLALSIMAPLSGHVGQAGHRHPMASSRLLPVLALSFEIGTAVGGSRNSQADS